MRKDNEMAVGGILILANLLIIGGGLLGGEIRSVDDAIQGLTLLAILNVIIGGTGFFLFGGREE